MGSDPLADLAARAVNGGSLTQKQVAFALAWVEAGRPADGVELRDCAKAAGYAKPRRDARQLAKDPKVIEFAATVCALTRGSQLDRVSRAQAPMSSEDIRASLLHSLHTIVQFDGAQMLAGNSPRSLDQIPADMRWCVSVKTKVSVGGKEGSADVDTVELQGPKLSERLGAAKMMIELLGIEPAKDESADADKVEITQLALPENARVPGGHAGRAADA